MNFEMAPSTVETLIVAIAVVITVRVTIRHGKNITVDSIVGCFRTSGGRGENADEECQSE